MRLHHRIGTVSVALTCLFSSLSFAQGKLWVVSKSGCPKVDFTEIQPAVDAASDGDVILVQPGDEFILVLGVVPVPTPYSYAGFAVDGKSVSVVTGFLDAAHPYPTGGLARPEIVGTVEVRNLDPNQQFVLKGFVHSSARLSFENNLGPLLIEDCLVKGVKHSDPFTSNPQPTAVVLNSSSVALIRCEIWGEEWSLSALSNKKPGALALSSQFSNLFLFDSRLRGGYGQFGSGGCPLYSPDGGDGGDGLLFTNGLLYLSGTTVQGGEGGGASLCVSCGKAGNGGVGLLLEGGSTEAYALDSQILGGAGGEEFYGCSSSLAGSPGVAISGSAAAQLVQLPGSYRSFEMDSMQPYPEGQTAFVQLTGDPGDQGYIVLSVAVPMGQPFHSGVLIAGFPLLSTIGPTGIFPATGSLPWRFPAPGNLVLPGRGVAVFSQSWILSSSLQWILGAPTVITILDATHDFQDGC